jgi:hypothetical protein
LLLGSAQSTVACECVWPPAETSTGTNRLAIQSADSKHGVSGSA